MWKTVDEFGVVTKIVEWRDIVGEIKGENINEEIENYEELKPAIKFGVYWEKYENTVVNYIEDEDVVVRLS